MPTLRGLVSSARYSVHQTLLRRRLRKRGTQLAADAPPAHAAAAGRPRHRARGICRRAHAQRTKSAQRARASTMSSWMMRRTYYRKYQSFEYWRSLIAASDATRRHHRRRRDRRIRLRLRQQHAAAARSVPARTGGRDRHQPEPAGDPQPAAGGARTDRALHRGRDGCAEGLCAARVRRPRRRVGDPASSRRAGALCRAGDAHPAPRRRGDLLRAVRGRLCRCSG